MNDDFRIVTLIDFMAAIEWVASMLLKARMMKLEKAK